MNQCLETALADRREPAARVRRRTGIGSRRAVLVCTAVLVLAGCGDPGIEDGSVSPSDSDEPTSVPPATRLLEPQPEDVDLAPVTAIDAAVIDEACPVDVPVDPNATESSLILDEQFRLEPMLGVVLEYGNEHPDQFGGYGLHWLAAGDASVFVSFTGNLAAHREALAERVEFPRELIVCQAAATEIDRSAIQATLFEELTGRFTSIGSGGKSGAVTVTLNPTEELLAGGLTERYGAAVDVSVGALDYPLDGAEVVCPPPFQPSLADGLVVSIVDAGTERSVGPAGTIALTARLTNTSAALIRFGSGQPTAVVTDSLGAPRTIDTRVVAAVGTEVVLEADAHQDVDLDVSVGSCDPADGYLVPAGEHFVVVSFYNAQLRANMNSEPLPVTIGD